MVGKASEDGTGRVDQTDVPLKQAYRLFFGAYRLFFGAYRLFFGAYRLFFGAYRLFFRL